MQDAPTKLLPYRESLAGTLLAARESVMAPIRPILRRFHITEQQWRVLRVLDNEGPTDASSLAELALLRPPSLTRILRELEDRKLIERLADGEDRRRLVVSISAEGVRQMIEISAETVEVLQNFTEAFGGERLAGLRTELMQFAETVTALYGANEKGT